jgi:16S rRNA (cytosine967-C5)-methyltransferase
LQALCEDESPTWLRVNRLRTNPDTLATSLASEGVEISRDTPDPFALRVTGGENLPWATQAWRDGQCTVQDIGAMLAACLLDPQPGMAVLDACAAPGGKTGHLYELMEGKGRLVASEVQPDRRQELRRTLGRLYGPAHTIEVPEINNLASLDPAESFDRVLVDAPCQAIGLIRRHPEIRWDGRLKRQAAMVKTQRQVLDDSSRLVKPGGRLLWVTCSPTRAENEVLIKDWLKVNDSWEQLNIMDLTPASWQPFVQSEGLILRTRPDLLACDGFAMCLLGRE